MHVSLYRRSHRVGRSMQYLLWLCFGLLAVVPWQVIRGQDRPVSSGVDQTSGDPISTRQSATEESTARQSKHRQTAQASKDKKPNPNWLSVPSATSLIFRGQSAPEQGPGPDMSSAADPAPRAGYDLTRIPGSETADEFMASDRLTGRSGQSMGFLFQANVLTGPGIGRKKTITPLQAMPYIFVDNNLFFADMRGFTDFANGWGANVGGGYRHYFPGRDRIFGVNGYLDYDNTSGALFRELGFGVESLGALYDVRANAYLPVGTTSQQLSLTNINGTQQFVNHFLLVDQQKIIANALHGFDSEIGVPLPGRVGQRHDIRVFGGGYWFEGTERPSFGGWKTRIQGNILPSVSVQLQVSNDPQFKTNVVFGGSWTFGGYRQPDNVPKTQFDRMTTPVQRQYNMVVGQINQTNKGITVIDPTTNTPYFFEHVSSNATGLVHDGTVEHPFLTVADAQAVDKPNDIIFVHANSTYSGVALALQPNVRVLGEASTVEHTVNTAGGPLLLPHPTAGVTARPLFTNSPGNGVVLASNSEFSGFQIGDSTVAGSGPAGVGIFGLQVSNVVVRETDVSFSGGEGVNLTQTSGTITFQGDVINAPTSGATAFHVNGTTGNVIFTSDPLKPITQQNPTPGVINNTGGLALLVENTVAGSVVDFTGSTVNDKAGQGILFTNDAGQVDLGNADLQNELANGISILNDSGTVIGSGNVTIAGVVGDAINVQNLAAKGQVSFLPTGSINISGRQARGINLQDNKGAVGILAPVIIAANNNTIALPAIEYQGSSGNAVFGNITISSGGPGILIDPNAANVPDSGQFTVRGTTTITGTGGNAIEVNNVDSVVTFNTINITERGAIGIEILDTRSPVSFTGITTITNTNNFTNLPGIDIRGNSKAANISFQNASIVGATGPAALGFGGVGLNIGGTQAADFNPGQVNFTTLNVSSTSGIAVFADHVGDTTTSPPTGGLFVQRGAISSTFDTAVDIQNSAMQVVFTSVSSVQSPTNGIRLINDTSFNNSLATALGNFSFTVTGNVTGRGSGGSIIQSGGDGIILNNAGSVSLSGMNITQNGVNGIGNFGNGVIATNMIHLQMTADGVIQNRVNGVKGTNVQQVDITNTLFTQNGLNGSGNQINLTATALLPLISPTNGAYRWNIADNTGQNGFTGGFVTAGVGGDAVFISNSGRLQDPVSGLTTPLILNFNDNSVLMNSTGTSALNVAWTGPESGNLNTNNLQLANANVGFNINNTDLNFLTNFNVLGNTVTGVGLGNVGLLVNNNGPTDLFIGNIVNRVTGVITPSTWTFTQAGGNAVNALGNIAMQFTTGPNSNLDIFSNTVTMNGSANVADGFLIFKFLENPTTVTISNNLVTETNQAFANGEGVEFLSTNGTVNLNGLLNNIITINGLNQAGPQWVFVSGGASTAGRFLVNGFFVP